MSSSDRRPGPAAQGKGAIVYRNGRGTVVRLTNTQRMQKMPVANRAVSDPMMEMSRCRLEDIEISFAHAGPPDGELIVLLHGFPEHWAAWSGYMVPLAHAGFHIVAPDQRGYGLSDKPGDVADYDLDRLAADIVGLARH